MRVFAILSLLALAFPASGCGGGGASAAAAEVPTPTPTPDPVPAPEPTPDPVPTPTFDAALEAQLRTLASQGGAAALAAPPAQDPDLVELGRMLFFDRELSGNRDISCYTCHDLDHGTGDALSVSIGTGGFGGGPDRLLADGTLIGRNAPSLFHLAGRNSLFWDGRVLRRQDGTLVTPEASLNGPAPAAAAVVSQLTSAVAAQAIFPLVSVEEMRGTPGQNEVADAPDNGTAWARIVDRLVGTDDGAAPGIAEYRRLFALAYPEVARWDDVHVGHVGRAIAAFEVASFDTRGAAFDAWLAGAPTAISEDAKRGGVLFYGRAGCARCHGGPAFTDNRHHAIGVPQVGPGVDFAIEDTGRARVTGDAADLYRFRTPSLRNAELTGPWMHDGAYTTLEAAVAHYRNPEASLRGYDASQLAPLLRDLVDRDPLRQDARARAIAGIVRDGVRLSDAEVAQLVAFLRTLTDAGALDLSAVEPATVPSGLPIDDE